MDATGSSNSNGRIRKTAATVAVFYGLVAFEFFYMASPFALYLYSAYGPSLDFLNRSPRLAWLSSFFLPHIVSETASPLLDLHNVIGAVLFVGGLLAFGVCAAQVYYAKLARKGAVLGGIYRYVRHPQYAALAISSFGLLLLWPRTIVVLLNVAMLFVYYFLARAEERECEQRFGSAYLEYSRRVGMFLPFRLPVPAWLPGLPRQAVLRLLAVLSLYVLCAGVGVGGAALVREWTLASLYTYDTSEGVFLSVARMDAGALERVAAIVRADPQVEARIAKALPSGASGLVNYVLPAAWHGPEIPMEEASEQPGHVSPAEYDRNQYKVMVTVAELRTGHLVTGLDLLRHTARRIPVVGVWVDLAEGKVTRMQEPPKQFLYEGVPVSLF